MLSIYILIKFSKLFLIKKKIDLKIDYVFIVYNQNDRLYC